MTDEKLALKIRMKVIEMAHSGKTSHVASALSMTDIVAVLYNNFLNPCNNPHYCKDVNRNRFVLSKAHAVMAVYAAMALKEIIDVEELITYGQDGSKLVGHTYFGETPGLDFSTSSLGQGIGVAAGFAMTAKYDCQDYRVFCIVGDGECNEGSVWETALFSAHHKLNNLTVIVDRNRLQALGNTEDILALGDISEKWRAFGWEVVTVDGHNCAALRDELSVIADKPRCVVANTIKGKGIPFMENNNIWHYRDPQGEEYKQAIDFLNRISSQI